MSIHHSLSKAFGSSRPEHASAHGQVTTGQVIVIFLTLAIGLYVDQAVEIWGQIAASIAAWAVMLTFLHRARGDLRILMVACLAWITLGEIFASLVWGLYKYRLYNVPFFVPPGHVLMLMAALYLVERARGWVLAAAPVIAIAYSIYALATNRDMLSVAVTPVFIGVLLLAKARHIYAATFLLVIPLEFYGTWMGNWRWESSARWIDLSMSNPPVCVGALYGVRDALAAMTLILVRRWQQRSVVQHGAQPNQLPRGSAVLSLQGDSEAG